MLVADLKDTFKIKEGMEADYITTMERRPMNICRVVGQGVVKRKSAPWVLALPWVDKKTTPGEKNGAVLLCLGPRVEDWGEGT